jgi:hypothetical protein
MSAAVWICVKTTGLILRSRRWPGPVDWMLRDGDWASQRGEAHSSIKTGQGIGLSDDASSQGRTPWLMEIAVNASAVWSYFVPIHVAVITSVTARSPPAERPAKSPAKHTGSPNPRARDYFRGSINIGRVQAWRSHHPGYWRKGRRAGVALQDLLTAQPIGSASETNKTAHTPLQDLIIAQPVGFANETASSAQTPLQEILLAQRAVLIGLIAHIVGTTFEDDIARSTDRLLRLGQDLLAGAAARAQPADRGTGGDWLRELRIHNNWPSPRSPGRWAFTHRIWMLWEFARFVVFFLGPFFGSTRAASILPPRPPNLAAAARRACQGWPRLRGHPQGSALIGPSTAACSIGSGLQAIPILYANSNRWF